MWCRSSVALTAVFALLAAAPASAQSEAVLRGQVVAQADGFALGQGRVALTPDDSGPEVETSIDLDGRFAFQGLRPGAYTLTATSDGFADQALRVVLEPREVRTVVVRLAIRGLALSVAVAAELPRLPSTHSPSSTVLTADRLASLPGSQRTLLPDAIVTAAPGMIRGHDDFVHIRGEEVALNPLVNGVSFWENAHAVFSAGFSPAVIDTANVMTGAFPAEYGNRFGGVVDIVTKSGLRMSRDGSISVNGGRAGRLDVLGDVGGHSSRAGYYAFGTLFESDRFLSPPSPGAIHDHGTGGHGFFQFDGVTGRGLVRAILGVDGTDFEIPVTPQDVELRPDAAAGQRTRQQTAILGWNAAQADRTLGLTVYERWSRADLLPASGPLTALAAQRRDLLTIGAKVDVGRLAGPHAIKAGVDLVRLRPHEELAYDDTGFRELAPLIDLPHIHITDNRIDFTGTESGGQWSGYVQDDIRLGSRVTANLGVRLDRYDLLVSTTQASPRVNVAVEAGGGAVVHASYSRFFVPPPIESVLSSGAGLTARIREIGVALPPVQPTTEDQFELGASSPAGPFQLGLTAYYRASDNPVHTTVWPDARLYSYASFDRARAHGLEAKADLPMLSRYGLNGYVNYALGRAYFYNPVTGGFVTEAEHLEEGRFLAPMDQTHTVTGGLTYRHSATGLWMGTAVEYGSGTPSEHGDVEDAGAEGEAGHTHAVPASGAGRVPGHVITTVSLGLDLLRARPGRSRLSFRVDVENIGGRQYLIAQESEFTPGQYSIPRLLSAGVTVRF